MARSNAWNEFVKKLEKELRRRKLHNEEIRDYPNRMLETELLNFIDSGFMVKPNSVDILANASIWNNALNRREIVDENHYFIIQKGKLIGIIEPYTISKNRMDCLLNTINNSMFPYSLIKADTRQVIKETITITDNLKLKQKLQEILFDSFDNEDEEDV